MIKFYALERNGMEDTKGEFAFSAKTLKEPYQQVVQNLVRDEGPSRVISENGAVVCKSYREGYSYIRSANGRLLFKS